MDTDNKVNVGVGPGKSSEVFYILMKTSFIPNCKTEMSKHHKQSIHF